MVIQKLLWEVWDFERQLYKLLKTLEQAICLSYLESDFIKSIQREQK